MHRRNFAPRRDSGGRARRWRSRCIAAFSGSRGEQASRTLAFRLLRLCKLADRSFKCRRDRACLRRQRLKPGSRFLVDSGLFRFGFHLALQC